MIKRPEGWTEDQCMDIPAAVINEPLDDKGNFSDFVVSCWELSDDELQALTTTKKVYLMCAGGMPPACITIVNPVTHGIE